MDKYLKDENKWLLRGFFTLNCLIFITYIVANKTIVKTIQDFKLVDTDSSVVVVIIPLFVFILNGLLTPDFKATISFWKIKNPLPGCKAFSDLMKKDSRIDSQELKRKHGELPLEPEKQNNLWYKIYKKNSGEVSVAKSHKAYLLARDLTSMSFLFLIFSTLFFLLNSSYKYWYWYLLGLFLQYLLLKTVTENYGNRFVTNVLAVESTNS